LSTLALYFHTLRHLRPTQVVARAWFRLHRPRADLRSPPPRRAATGVYVPPCAGPISLLGPHTFRFLNVERDCADSSGWSPRDADKLWTYNLHYFDDLNAEGSAVRAAWHLDLLLRWVQENPPGAADAWEPYALSRRVVNWVKWAARGNVLPHECHASLAVQTRWLMQRLEYHLLGNHLFMNAKALVHAGLYFEGDEAAGWLRKGLQIIGRELAEQVLPDGGHFERSPMYHAAMLEDVLDLINVARAYALAVPPEWLDVVGRMQGWLRAMSHPDGEVSFFNDSSLGIAPRAAELATYAGRLHIADVAASVAPLTVLADSGYVSATVGPAKLIGDCAPLGPDYQPGHAHADTLSFELSLFGRRVLVNSGTSVYGVSEERQRQRGTAAHNTIVVNGENSSEVWAGFRVARRARVILQRTVAQVPVVVAASHDGYRRLPGRNVHRRTWTLDEHFLTIEDRVSGRFERADAFLHLHPDARVRRVGPFEFELVLPEGNIASITFEGAQQAVTAANTWHPQFGVQAGSACIVARLGAEPLVTRVLWTRGL